MTCTFLTRYTELAAQYSLENNSFAVLGLINMVVNNMMWIRIRTYPYVMGNLLNPDPGGKKRQKFAK